MHNNHSKESLSQHYKLRPVIHMLNKVNLIKETVSGCGVWNTSSMISQLPDVHNPVFQLTEKRFAFNAWSDNLLSFIEFQLWNVAWDNFLLLQIDASRPLMLFHAFAHVAPFIPHLHHCTANNAGQHIHPVAMQGTKFLVSMDSGRIDRLKVTLEETTSCLCFLQIKTKWVIFTWQANSTRHVYAYHSQSSSKISVHAWGVVGHR